MGPLGLMLPDVLVGISGYFPTIADTPVDVHN